LRIEYLITDNFRNFYGSDNRIDFASGDNSVTVIHGKNGSGKSTILNAFTWALYGSFTKSIKNKTKIINKRSIAEVDIGKPISCSVSIKFSHEESTYLVKKTQLATKLDNELNYKLSDKPILDMKWHSGDGNWSHANHPEDVINRVLPKDLFNYFFFDGERMTEMVAESKKQKTELRNAAKKLLGLEVLERSILHLNKAAKEFESELGNTGGAELQGLVSEKNNKNTQIDVKKKRNDEITKENEQCNNLIKEIDEKLIKNQKTKKLQEQRSALANEKDKVLNPRLEIINKNFKKELSNSGYIIFSESLLDACSDRVESMREAGELPKGIKRQFVEDLINQKKCICGEDLIEGSKRYGNVSEWKSKAGLEDVEQRAISIGASVKLIRTSIDQTAENFRSLKNEKTDIKNKLSIIESKLDDISEKLKGLPTVELSSLEERRRRNVTDSDTLISEFNNNSGVIQHLESEIRGIDVRIQGVQATQNRVILAQDRLQATKDSIDVLNKMLLSYQESFKDSLQDTMRKIFRDITDLIYLPFISDDFDIGLKEATTGVPVDVGESTGQGQVLSITFILGIIEQARIHVRDQIIIAKEDLQYPLVMDSPFGQLDDDNKAGVAKYLAKIADQTILLVSLSQWKDAEDSIRHKVGREYFLTYHNPNSNRPDVIKRINNQDVVLETSSEQYEWASIQEMH